MRIFLRGMLFALCVVLLWLLSLGYVSAATWPAFAGEYRPVAKSDMQQAQVVYYRLKAPNVSAGAAHLYVGQQLHSSLLPGGFNVFCLAPGRHVLGAYLDDAPLYAGKSSELFAATLKGGKTYFVKVREHGDTTPIPMPRSKAERELVGHREQVHVISRASTVQDCRR